MHYFPKENHRGAGYFARPHRIFAVSHFGTVNRHCEIRKYKFKLSDLYFRNDASSADIIFLGDK